MTGPGFAETLTYFDAITPEHCPDAFGLSEDEMNEVFAEVARYGLRLRAFRDTGFGVPGALAFGVPFHLGPPGRGRLGFTAQCWTGRILVRSRANGAVVIDCATWAEVAAICHAVLTAEPKVTSAAAGERASTAL